MRKFIFLLLFLNTIVLSAQTPLPFNYSFENPFPTQLPSGVTIYLGSPVSTTYTTSTSAHTIPACKLDGTGEYFLVWFNEQTSSISYWLKGSTPMSNPFTGTFSIEQSSNGILWTNLRQLVDTQLGTTNFQQFIDNPLATTIYSFLFYQQSQW